MPFRKAVLVTIAAAIALGGCKREGELVIEQGVGITALRSVCPAVGVPEFTGNMTVFDPVTARTADAIDVAATITNVRSSCDDAGEQVYTSATFDVLATRPEAGPARSVELPYYATVLRGGSAVIAKRVGTVQVDFAAGETRAQGSGTAQAYVNRAEATLPGDIRERITRRRRAGDDSAAIDPLTEPDVRAAVSRATFELLIGFQLTEEQLAYNALR